VYRFWTIVKLFLGKCQVLHRSRKKLRTGRKSRQHTRAIQPFISGQPKAFSGQEATGSPPGGSLAALGRQRRVTTMKSPREEVR
jgi:hypothetical protein